MKRRVLFFIASFLTLGAGNVLAQDVQNYNDNGFIYEDNTKETLIRYVGNSSNVDILSKVKVISDGAFSGNSNVVSVTIPGSVTSIGNSVFYNCENLQTVDLSKAKGITAIPDYMFQSCGKLKNIEIPAWITCIGEQAFYECSSLQSIAIPATMTSIKKYAFSNCSNLTTVDFSKAENLTTIGQNAFSNCTKLAALDLRGAKNLTKLNSTVFYKCDGIQEIKFPANLTTIETGCFNDCNGLKKVVFPESLTTINSEAFFSCDNLETVDLTKATNFNSLGNKAFAYCSKLTEIKASSNKNFASVDGVLYNSDTTKLVCWPAGKTELKFPISVTTIGDYAFLGNTSLTKVTIPRQITSIGQYAFYSCGNLTTVDFSNAKSLTTISSRVFSYCSKLTSVDLSGVNNLTIIGSGAFEDCDNLIKVTIPKSVTTINDFAFYRCGNLETVDLSQAAGLITINGAAFGNCPKLKELNISSRNENFTSVDGVLYSKDKTKLVSWPAGKTEITIPNSVTAIGSYAFYGNRNLIKMVIPKQIATIGQYAYAYCTNLESIDFSNAENLKTIGTCAFHDCEILTEITIPNSVNTINEYAFRDCAELKTVSIGSGLINCYSNIFDNCDKIETVYFNNSSSSAAPFKGKNLLKTVVAGDKVTYIPANAFANCYNLESVDLSKATKLTTISNSAFSGCGSLTEISVPSSVTSIGTGVFYGCEKLKFNEYDGACYVGNKTNKYVILIKAKSADIRSCRIPDETKVIVASAFSGCTKLKNLTIGSGVASIGSYAFSDCPIETLTYNTNAIGAQFSGKSSLKTVNVGSKVTSIDSKAFYNCSNLQTVNLNSASKLEKIESEAFENCVSLTEIAIPESVVLIGINAFCYCSNLAKVDFSKAKSLTALYTDAFFGCSSLTGITIPESVKRMDLDIFGSCSKLEKVDLSKAKNLTSINTYTFANCTNLKTVILGSGITSIAGDAFYNCNNIENLTYNSNVIGTAFSNYSALKNLNIGDNATSIAANAFENCSGLTSVKIGKGVTHVGDNAFNGCNNIESVVIENDNVKLWNAELYFIKDGIRYNVIYKNAVEVGSNNYKGNVVIPATFEAGDTYKVIGIANQAFSNCRGLESIDLSNATNLDYIGWEAFYKCNGLTEITIPESVTKINAEAFNNCYNLETVDLSKAKILEYIGDYAFNECQSLSNIKIPASVTYIGEYAFYNCDNLETVSLGNAKNLESIGEYAFYKCGALSNIKIPASVTSIGDEAFGYCTSLNPILCEAENQPDEWYWSWNFDYSNGYRPVIWNCNNIAVNTTVNNSKWGTVSGAGTYAYGDEVMLKATPAKGMFFAGWYEGNSRITNHNNWTFTVEGNKNVTAVFYSETECTPGDNTVYVINEVENNGVFTPDISGSYAFSASTTTNYRTHILIYDADWNNIKSGYNNCEANLEAGQKYHIATSMLSYSNFEYINLVIEAPCLIEGKGINGTVEGAGLYKKGQQVNLRANADDHYQFVKWSDGLTSISRSFYANGNATYTAEFEPETYTIAASANSENAGTVEGAGNYVYNSNVTLTAKPNEGFEFLHWNDGSTENPRKFKAVKNVTYEATLGIKSYTVNYTAQHATVTVYGEQNFIYNTNVSFLAEADENYEIVDLRDKKGNILATGGGYYFQITKNTDIVVNVQGKPFEINATMENGTVEGTGVHRYGTTATLTAIPQPGYKFIGWEDGETSATRTFTVTKEENLQANTAPIQYSVKLSTSDALKGTVTGDGNSYHYNQVVPIEAQPIGENKFVRWSDGNTSASRNLTIQRDWSLTAVFSDQTLYVISATAEANGSVFGAGRYADGETATLTASANPGYKFKEWSDGNTDAVRTIKVTASKELTARFEKVTYTLTVAAGANGTATGSGSFTFGEEATLTATADAGYHFESWSDGNTDANRTFSVTRNTTLTAEFAINTYDVKATAKNGTVEGSGTYTHGTEATLTATADQGYHFSQWSDGNTTNPRKATVTSDMDLVAEIAINSYEITAAAQNGTVEGTGTYNHGAIVTLIATAADGYHFTKWADGVVNSQRSEVVKEDKKYTAEFEVNAYNVSAMAQNGTVDGTGIYNYGEEATLTATADQGYYFIQWSDGVKTKSRTETVTGSISLKAEFEINSYTISVAEAENGSISGTGTYNYGAIAIVTAIADEGYHFTQWSDGVTSASRRLTVVEDAELSASFEINSYEVKLSAENGTVTGSGTYEYGEYATINAEPASHYHFVRWSDGSIVNPRTLTVTRNRHLTAYFEPDLYTIEVAAENGTVYGASSQFEFGAVATLTATADFGYHFVKWTDGNTDNPRLVTVDATVLSDIRPFTAVFEKNPEPEFSHVAVDDEEAAEVNIYAFGNTIVVENADADIYVYDAMGRMIVETPHCDVSTEIRINTTGVYVVKTGNVSKRVMIK